MRHRKTYMYIDWDLLSLLNSTASSIKIGILFSKIENHTKYEQLRFTASETLQCELLVIHDIHVLTSHIFSYFF